MMDIHVPLQFRLWTKCPRRVSIALLISRIRHEWTRHSKHIMSRRKTNLLMWANYTKNITTTTYQEKQNRSTEGCSKFKSLNIWKTCKSQSGTGPGVRGSKRPLLACRARCECSMENSRNDVKIKFSNKVWINNRVKNWCNAWSMEGVTVRVWSSYRKLFIREKGTLYFSIRYPYRPYNFLRGDEHNAS